MYSQTCSNDHLCKTTNAESAQTNSIQSLLYKMTTTQLQPATTFFCPQNEKDLSKTATAKFYPVEKWVAIYKK